MVTPASVCRVGPVILAALASAAGAGAQQPSDAGLFDAAVPQGLAAAVVLELGVPTWPPDGRLLPDLVRMLYEAPGVAPGEIVERLSRLETDPVSAGVGRTPMPLTPEAWSRLLGRDVTADNALAAVLSDRRAALLACGLAALDASTRSWLSDRPALLQTLHARAAPGLAAFGRALRVADGRILTPGGPEAEPLWAAVAGVSPADADRFVERLFDAGDDGRLAYLYDTIANLDEARARFALGLWIAEDGGRTERFQSLYREIAGAFRREWRVADRPFSRMQADAAHVLLEVRVDARGEPLGPVWQRLWKEAFASGDLSGTAGGSLRNLEQAPPLDATALLALLAAGDPAARTVRLETFAFGQRVFQAATERDAGDVLVALRAWRTYPALMGTLERAGIGAPSIYAAAARRAEELSGLKRDPASVALRQFQGSLAIVTRLRERRVLDDPTTAALVRDLVEAAVDGRRAYAGAVTHWLETRLFPALGWRAGDGEPAEPRLLAALAGLGAAAEAGMPRFVRWEDHDYRVDLVAAEIDRLSRVRARQGGLTLDEALDVARAAARISDPATPHDVVAADIARLASAAYGRPRAADPADVVAWPPPVPQALGAMAALTRASLAGDFDRVPRLAPPIVDFSDVLVADVLASIVYAVSLGDPDGRVLVGPNVAYRHDFGFDLPSGKDRRRLSWSVPAMTIQAGRPWHVSGSLLALDVALAPYGMRRVILDAELRAPVLNSNDRRTFVDTVALMNPFALTDADRDALAGAMARGRERVARASADGGRLDGLAREAGVDAWRREEIRWQAARGAGDIERRFSLAELVRLGRPAVADLDAWGMSATPLDGCLCTRFPSPGDWRSYAGRPGVGMIATQVADLTLRVVELLAGLDLPASLTPYVLSAAALEFVDRVQPLHEDDWRTLVETARALTRERVEDYVAALAVDGPLIPDGDRPPESFEP